MAEFSKLIITGKGQTLIAKMIAENAGMEFTKIATSGTMYKPEQLEGLEALADIKQTSLIAKITRTNDVAVKIETSFNNLELTEGYYMRALGLYADDPDEGEILYAVTTEVSGNCYIPPYNGVTVSGAYVKLITTVGNAQHVSLEVDAAATATIGNIQDLRDNLDTVEISFTDEEVTERENIQPRDTLGTICRKIKKWLSDLKTGAFASVVDNCTTTEEGTVLDGRQGKALQDQITELREADGEINSKLDSVFPKSGIIIKSGNIRTDSNGWYDIGSWTPTRYTLVNAYVPNGNIVLSGYAQGYAYNPGNFNFLSNSTFGAVAIYCKI